MEWLKNHTPSDYCVVWCCRVRKGRNGQKNLGWQRKSRFSLSCVCAFCPAGRSKVGDLRWLKTVLTSRHISMGMWNSSKLHIEVPRVLSAWKRNFIANARIKKTLPSQPGALLLFLFTSMSFMASPVIFACHLRLFISADQRVLRVRERECVCVCVFYIKLLFLFSFSSLFPLYAFENEEGWKLVQAKQGLPFVLSYQVYHSSQRHLFKLKHKECWLPFSQGERVAWSSATGLPGDCCSTPSCGKSRSWFCSR